MPNTYSPTSLAYRRIAIEAAGTAICGWLRSLHRSTMYFFEVDGIECALEYFTGHWGFEEGGRWRWGRVDAGDPDENTSNEDVLLDVALGCSLPPQPPSTTRRRRRDIPALAEPSDLTRAEIRTQVMACARENLGKLMLRPLPRG